MPNPAADAYLANILTREAVDTSQFSPVRHVASTLAPIIQSWAGSQLLSVTPSGSFAKGTANKSATDIDLFISMSDTTTNTLKEIYDTLTDAVRSAGYAPRTQNVSIRIKVNGYTVDLVPGKRQTAFTSDHSLFRTKTGTWTKTNVGTHISTVIAGGRTAESRILKLWRDQNGLDFPSFYIELTTIAALAGSYGSLSDNVWRVFQYLRDSFANARVVDPANFANILSDDLTVAEKAAIKVAAVAAIGADTWGKIVR